MATATQPNASSNVSSPAGDTPRDVTSPSGMLVPPQYSYIMSKQERKKYKQFNKSKQSCLKTLSNFKTNCIDSGDDDDVDTVSTNNNINNNVNPFLPDMNEINFILDEIDIIFKNNYNKLLDGFKETETSCNDEWKVSTDTENDSDTDSDDDDETDKNGSDNKPKKPKVDTIGIMSVNIEQLNRLNNVLNSYQNNIETNLNQFKMKLNEIKDVLRLKTNENNKKKEEKVKKGGVDGVEAKDEEQQNGTDPNKPKIIEIVDIDGNDYDNNNNNDNDNEDEQEVPADISEIDDDNDENDEKAQDLDGNENKLEEDDDSNEPEANLYDLDVEIRTDMFKNDEVVAYQRELEIERANVKKLKEIILELQNEQSNYSYPNILEADSKQDLNSTIPRDYNFNIISIEHPGNVFINAGSTIAWYVKNTGRRPFNLHRGNEIKLGFVRGDGLLISNYQIPRANINDTVFIKLNFYAFNRRGTYISYYRLTKNGRYFGPMLEVKINVIDNEKQLNNIDNNANMKSNKATTSEDSNVIMASAQSVGNNNNNSSNRRQQRMPAPRVVHANTSNSNNSNNNNGNVVVGNTPSGYEYDMSGMSGLVSSGMVEEDDNGLLNCVCGKELILMKVKEAYKGKNVYCDICRKQCQGFIFHCPNGDCKAHRGGFDLCSNCATSQNPIVFGR